MKKYVKNIIMIMSGGIGARFGSDCPKQYNYMNGRPVIDYVMDACKKSIYVDEIIVVASQNYVAYVSERFNVPTVIGGDTRPKSVANGIRYIHENYDCEKLIITNAVCPLAATEQYNKYFEYLDEYDFVLTTWKLAPALHRFDGIRVDRDDFFNIMEPDAYRFKKLYQNFNFVDMKKYIFHNMPEDSEGYYCFDYPYTTKVTYPFDIPVLEILYKNLIEKPKQDQTLQMVNKYLSSDGTVGIEKWINSVQVYVKEIAQKYSVITYMLNSQTQANIVYEGESITYGDLIIKFSPSEYDFHKELVYYKLADKSYMAKLIGYDEQYRALILSKINPGIQVKFHKENRELKKMYNRISDTLIPEERLKGDVFVPRFIDEFAKFSTIADKHRFEYNYRKTVEKKAKRVWKYYFEDADKYYLHGDIQRRNILNANGQVVIIDPRGTIAPREFEYTIQFITELREDIDNVDLIANYQEMLEYFKEYVDEERMVAALYVFWVHKLNDYVFHKNDGYKLAKWCKDCIQRLFFYSNMEDAMNPECAPNGVKMI